MERVLGEWGDDHPRPAHQSSHPNHFCTLASLVCELYGAAYLQFPAVKPEGKGHRKQPDIFRVTLAQDLPTVPNLQWSAKL